MKTRRKKPKFNTSKIIKPSTIRSTTNQDHRILHVLPQILTQSIPNSQQIKRINPVNKPTQIKKPIRTNPNQYNQTQILPPMTDTINTHTHTLNQTQKLPPPHNPPLPYDPHIPKLPPYDPHSP